MVTLAPAAATVLRRLAGRRPVLVSAAGPKAAVGGEEGLRGIEAASDDLSTTAFEACAGAVLDDFAEAVSIGEVVLTGEKLFGKSLGVGIGKIAAVAQADGDGLGLAMLLEEMDRAADEAGEGSLALTRRKNSMVSSRSCSQRWRSGDGRA